MTKYNKLTGTKSNNNQTTKPINRYNCHHRYQRPSVIFFTVPQRNPTIPVGPAERKYAKFTLTVQRHRLI